MLKKVPKTNILVAQYNIGLKWFGTLLPDHFKPSVGKGVILLFFWNWREWWWGVSSGHSWIKKVKLKIIHLSIIFDKKASMRMYQMWSVSKYHHKDKNEQWWGKKSYYFHIVPPLSKYMAELPFWRMAYGVSSTSLHSKASRWADLLRSTLYWSLKK